MSGRRADNAEVLAAAGRLVRRIGVQEATLERIAEEAGLSRTTLHRRGVTREQILLELADGALHAYRDALWPALTANGSARDRLEQALVGICEVAEEHLALFKAFSDETGRIFHRDEDAAGRTPFTEPLERLLRDGSADGTLRAVDAGLYAVALFNLVGWTYVHIRSEHQWDAGIARTTVLDIALRGVEAHPP